MEKREKGEGWLFTLDFRQKMKKQKWMSMRVFRLPSSKMVPISGLHALGVLERKILSF